MPDLKTRIKVSAIALAGDLLPNTSMVFAIRALAVASRFKNRSVMLFVEPAEEFLKSVIGEDSLDGIEFVAELVV